MDEQKNNKKKVSIIFTKKNYRTLPPDIEFYLNKDYVEVQNEAKFIVLTFNKALTWTTHINNITTKCRKAVNILRLVASKTWGASKTTLITIYKALIRSRFDYGSELFYTASKANLNTLNSIQYQALKTATGALR